FCSLRPLQPISTLFPYTTLFRSNLSNTPMLVSGSFHFPFGSELVGVDAVSKGHRRERHLRAFGPSVALLRPELLAGLLRAVRHRDRKSTRLNSSHVAISYAVFCL